MANRQRHPGIHRHKGIGQAYVRLNGKFIYLGAWPEGKKTPPPEAMAEYDRVIAEWLQSGRAAAPEGAGAKKRARPRPEAAQAPAEAAGEAGRGRTVLTVAVAMAAFLRHAKASYRDTDGQVT